MHSVDAKQDNKNRSEHDEQGKPREIKADETSEHEYLDNVIGGVVDACETHEQNEFSTMIK